MQWNEPLYNEVLGTTNDVRFLSSGKFYEKSALHNETRDETSV